MASVYKAYDPTEDRYVALKILYPDLALDKQFNRRFRREAKVVMGLKHPNIVPVEDFGENDEYAYLVMPLLNLGSLADRLQEGPLTFEEGSQLMDQVTAGLQFAHDRGVVHRDVKPSNILLEEEGVALMADFGLARIEDASVSLTGSALIGTPAYMSPEQALGEPADARSDQYSMGVILYQLSTGTLPFDAETPMAIVLKQIREPLPLARAQSPNVPDSVERVILKSTAKNPEHRFASIAEMNRVFQAGVAHELDPSTHPVPTIELPPISSSIPADQATLVQPPERERRRRVAGLIALPLLLLLLACPLSSSLLGDLMAGLGSPAEGGALVPFEMNEIELTELAGTIQAMSTELAAAQNGTLPPESIATFVMETLQAVPSRGTDLVTPDLTPTTDLQGKPWTETPGPSPAASLTLPPGPSSTPPKAPTKTPPLMPMATASPFPSSTATDVPTPTPSMTSTSAASATPTVSPSPTIDVCTLIALGSFGTAGEDRLRIRVFNNSSNAIQIDSLHLEWDSEFDRLRDIELGLERIWDVRDSNPPTDIPAEGDWIPGADRTIAPFGNENLTFRFDEEIDEGGYSVILTFDNGCDVSS